ncbi:MAG: TrkH family potassium uptake protein [Ruminococcus sp.]|nr:TrkH family potassium uptake protein [Ruminococcus sp.]
MNYKAVFNMLGKVIFLEGALMILPLIVALIYGEKDTYMSFVIPIVCLLALGLALGIKRPKNNMMLAKEGFAICGLAWILLSAFGCIPFVLSGMIPNYLDAFFETVSGFTTTGSTVLTTVEANPMGLLFWRSFTNWIGGMGVLTFFMAVVPQGEGQSMHLMRAEVPGPKAGKLVSKMTDAFRILYIIYFALTILDIVFLMFSGIGFYHSVVTAFATAGTGGFSVKDASIAGYNSPYVEYVSATFMMLFGINFNLYFFLFLRKFKAVLCDEELKVYFGVIISSIALIMINLMTTSEIGTEKAFRDSYFTVTTLVSSCGFVTADFEQWPVFSKAILLLLMFIGAMSGSTGGGIKITRVMLYFKEMVRDLKQMIRPRQVMSVRLNKKSVDSAILKGINTYLVIYIFIIMASILLVSVEGNSFETNFTAVFTCINNMGPGMDKVSATSNFAHLSPLTKIVLCFDMLAGRLEIYPIVLLLIPTTWKRH